MTYNFKRPPLPPEAYAHIAKERERGTTWLALSQEFRIPAEALKRRFQSHQIRSVVERAERFS